MMSGERFKNIVKKSFSIAAICFSMGILFVGIGFSFFGIYMEPVNIIRIWIGFFILGVLTVFRSMFDYTQWARSKPFYIKNILFMPLYLMVALIMAISIVRGQGVDMSLSLMISYAVLFLIFFAIRQFIEYFIQKAKTDKMNDALELFQKEHSWDDEE